MKSCQKATYNSVRLVSEKELERRAPQARESRRRRRPRRWRPQWGRGRVWGGGCPQTFSFFCLAVVHFGAFWGLVLSSFVCQLVSYLTWLFEHWR